MQQRNLKNRNDLRHSQQKLPMGMIYWTLVVIIMLQPTTTTAAKYKGDNCVSKGQPGICKEWSECPLIKTLIESGEYTNLEVVSCGFVTREELICCPVMRTDSTSIDSTSVKNKNGFTEPTTTQQPVKDFWLDLLPNTTSSTTATPDFWLDLIKTTTITSTTTLKPLIVGDQRLNETSEFFDFNALIGGSQRQKDLSTITPNNNHVFNQGLTTGNNNGGSNLNAGPFNVNQEGFDPAGGNFNNAPNPMNFNNGRGNNGHNQFPRNNNGNIGWGQLNNNMGRGPPNNNNRGHFNGRGAQNNGRFPNNMAMINQNQGFVFPHNDIPSNSFFGGNKPHHRPGTPVNHIQEQNPNTPFINNNKHNNHVSNDNDKRVEELIKNVFSASTNNNHDNLTDINVENTIANIFNIKRPQTTSANPIQQANNGQSVVWLTPQGDHNTHDVEYVQLPTPHQQIEPTNTQTIGHFQIMPAVENQIGSNALEEAPITSFIQQPVIVETWPSSQVHKAEFNPVQVVYENLVNSGMDILKAQETQVENIFNQQQQFNVQPQQLVVLQPQQPQIIYQQPQTPHSFGQQIPLQMESAGKEPRSTSTLQQFVQPSSKAPILNVQSPPTHVLDPFKPFEFRPPSADENNFLEDNNSLSPSPSSDRPVTKTSDDRPAVRACRRIEKGLVASLSLHILGGTPAELGEFPHMVGLGYSSIGGENKRPYAVRCGGTLIDKRFVLTAAHCVSDRDSIPSIVLLGVVNFTDPNQLEAAVELRIKQTYIHSDYTTRLTYNDIAILELESDVQYNEYIYPVCLYTNEKDPDTSVKLWVTGWGTVNTTTRSFSDILLKAPLHTTPLEKCNRSFTEYGLNRRIPDGIIRTQFCAEDKDQVKDACQGDSGGPLNMVVDESYRNYRLVGVVSSGFGCASSAPGLYTRVAAFLDFIEEIVWPNGGD